MVIEFPTRSDNASDMLKAHLITPNYALIKLYCQAFIIYNAFYHLNSISTELQHNVAEQASLAIYTLGASWDSQVCSFRKINPAIHQQRPGQSQQASHRPKQVR